MRHHVPGAGRHFGAEDVVLADEGNKGWRAVRHHVLGAGRENGELDVVRLDEEIRAGWQ